MIRGVWQNRLPFGTREWEKGNEVGEFGELGCLFDGENEEKAT